jgi:MHS family proline/betaine transporter-like MFS transporter
MAPPPTHEPVSRASIAIAALSTIVEWYDFTLYLYFATVLARVFFSGEQSLGLTLGGFAIAYLMRPLGALFFGHIGDTRGRRFSLLLSVVVMSAAMLATALLPTRATLGSSAAILLILLRCVMGFAVGGEYSGVVAYLLEGAKAERRGLIASLASAASEVGGLLAVGVSALTVTLTTPAELAAWGWRIPFFFGAALAGSIAVARSMMHESPEFHRQLADGTIPDSPVRHVWHEQRTGIWRSFAISALGSITYYVGITYVPAFLTSTGGMSEKLALWLSTAAAVMVIAVTPIAGVLSDRLGRRPLLVALTIGSIVLPASMFALMGSASTALALTGALVLAALAGAYSAVGASATGEQFAGEGRMTGLALGATGATAIFGGFTPWLAHSGISASGMAIFPGVLIAVVALAILPVLWRMPETAPRFAGRGIRG